MENTLKYFSSAQTTGSLWKPLRNKPYFCIPTLKFHLTHFSKRHTPEHHKQNLQNTLPTQDKRKFRKIITIYRNVDYFNAYLPPISYLFFFFKYYLFTFRKRSRTKAIYPFPVKKDWSHSQIHVAVQSPPLTQPDFLIQSDFIQPARIKAIIERQNSAPVSYN